jgi:predicted DNA-binding transcriptional regulator
MALKGNLRDFSVAQLLNLINLAHKTGLLVIEGSPGDARITFKEGKLAFAEMSGEDNSLAALLHRYKKFSTAQYQLLQKKAENMTDKELGLLLINAGYVTQQDILTTIQQYYIEIIRSLFIWNEGSFYFENDKLPPDGKISVRIDLENLIIEGSRQLKELEQLQDEIPTLDMSLKFIDRPGVSLKNISLSANEWRVVKYINPKNTIRQIARTVNMNDLEIRRVIYGLLQAGLIEVVRPEGKPLPVAGRVFPTAQKEEQISLVNRIINRIRAL